MLNYNKKIKAEPKTWDLENVRCVRCFTEHGEFTIMRAASFRHACRVVRAWASPLFRRAGATFEIEGTNGGKRGAWIQEVAKLFELELKASECKVQLATQAAQIAPPATIPAPAPIAIAVPCLPVTSEPTAPRSDGRVPVRKTILHRGRSFAVTYWVKQASIAA
jgi:hypothetical protein